MWLFKDGKITPKLMFQNPENSGPKTRYYAKGLSAPGLFGYFMRH